MMTLVTLLLVMTFPGIHSNVIPAIDTQRDYFQFLQEFGKNHDHLTDYRRIERFHHLHSLVNEHNAKKEKENKNKLHFTMKLNDFADLLPEELETRFGFREFGSTTQPQSVSKPPKSKSSKTKKRTKKAKFDDGYRSNYYPFFPWPGKEGNNEDSNDQPAGSIESLDWSSHNNPIGSSVISAVRNQGSCGACWAFVAVATVEASLRIALSSQRTNQATHEMRGADSRVQPPQAGNSDRNSNSIVRHASELTSMGIVGNEVHETAAARDAAYESVAPTKGLNQSDSAMRENTNTDILGIAATSAPTESSGEPSAQLLEGSAIAWIPSLSVQQLVDCDTSFNRGCSGGSPLFAFHYIADHGLVPWSRYEYEEKVDVCGAALSASSHAPVAKYFIRDYGKLSMLDSAALEAALSKGPVAVGVCGTDPYFMLYSSGVFDYDDCCIDQNHAITVVGYGHDSSSGLDYWLAQNSWGTRWGENGYIKIKKTDVLGESGLCGMLINPMYATGGYILDEQGRYIDPSRTAHYPIFVTNWEHWLQDNWREVMLGSSAVLMVASILVLVYACYLERLMYLASQVAALRAGYETIPDTT